MKLTQGLASIRPGITQERINGIYRSLDEYVEMVRQEHPEAQRQLSVVLVRYAVANAPYILRLCFCLSLIL